MKLGEAYVELDARKGKLDRALKTAEKGFRGAVAKMQRAWRKFGGYMQKYSTQMRYGLLAIVGAAALAVRAFAKQEQAERLLDAALKATGQSVEIYGSRLRKAASEIQNLTVYGDELNLALMATGLNLGATGDSVAQLTRDAIGLATALKMDVNTAMRYMVLATQGEMTMLQRYIPALRGTTDATKKIAIVTRMAAAGFEQAEAEGKALEGTAKRLGGRLGDILEKLGGIAAGGKDAAENLGVMERAANRVDQALGGMSERQKGVTQKVMWGIPATLGLAMAGQKLVPVLKWLKVGLLNAGKAAVRYAGPLAIAAAAWDTYRRSMEAYDEVMGDMAKAEAELAKPSFLIMKRYYGKGRKRDKPGGPAEPTPEEEKAAKAREQRAVEMEVTVRGAKLAAMQITNPMKAAYQELRAERDKDLASVDAHFQDQIKMAGTNAINQFQIKQKWQAAALGIERSYQTQWNEIVRQNEEERKGIADQARQEQKQKQEQALAKEKHLADRRRSLYEQTSLDMIRADKGRLAAQLLSQRRATNAMREEFRGQADMELRILKWNEQQKIEIMKGASPEFKGRETIRRQRTTAGRLGAMPERPRMATMAAGMPTKASQEAALLDKSNVLLKSIETILAKTHSEITAEAQDV